MLATPNFQLRFKVQTDASVGGIGAVLSQVQDGAEHPITYISQRLLKHERNYAMVEKECLAIKWVKGKLHYYLLGREFALITDHAPLKWIQREGDPLVPGPPVLPLLGGTSGRAPACQR